MTEAQDQVWSPPLPGAFCTCTHREAVHGIYEKVGTTACAAVDCKCVAFVEEVEPPFCAAVIEGKLCECPKSADIHWTPRGHRFLHPGVMEREAIGRVSHYVSRRTGRVGLDPNVIHAIDTGCVGETELLLSDLRVLVQCADKKQPRSAGAK